MSLETVYSRAEVKGALLACPEANFVRCYTVVAAMICFSHICPI